MKIPAKNLGNLNNPDPVNHVIRSEKTSSFRPVYQTRWQPSVFPADQVYISGKSSKREIFLFQSIPFFSFLLLILLVLSAAVCAEDEITAAWWNFDSLAGQETVIPHTRKGKAMPEIERVYSVREIISGREALVHGSFFMLKAGVRGKAILLDGNTSFVQYPAANVPRISADFSTEVWIAPAAYPTNWCPLIDHATYRDKGFFLGINARGQAGFKLKAGGKWWEVIADSGVSLRKWTYIAGTYSREAGMTLYVNGVPVAHSAVSGGFEPAESTDLLVGRHSIKHRPEGTIRPKGTAPVYTFFDGLIDEVKLYKRALTAAQVADNFHQYASAPSPPLAARHLPAGLPGIHRFGAVYRTLKYYPAWDALWPVGDRADVVVTFDELDGRFVFWRGTSYIPHWVTENGIWYDNEFCETWSKSGGHEPMSDKRCEFSHVMIIESTPARVIVHWRYALVDNWYHHAKVDSLTGWGEWADEVYTIYPDGVAVRAVTLYSTQPQSPHEWHEGIIVMGPGQRPEQVLEAQALTLANMEGQTYTFTWAKGIPSEAGKGGLVKVPERANIQLINTRSRLKPFVIVSPESNPLWEIFSNELRPDVSMFPWWNHWPAALKGSDGRYALEADRASHSSLSNCHWDAWRISEKSVTKLMLNGLTEKSAEQMIPLAASWAFPPYLSITEGSGFDAAGYDPASRCYQISYSRKSVSPPVLKFILEASEKSAAVNPAFVISNYGKAGAVVLVDGVEKQKDSDFRLGCRETIQGTDLVVWLKISTNRPFEVTLIPQI